MESLIFLKRFKIYNKNQVSKPEEAEAGEGAEDSTRCSLCNLNAGGQQKINTFNYTILLVYILGYFILTIIL